MKRQIFCYQKLFQFPPNRFQFVRIHSAQTSLFQEALEKDDQIVVESKDIFKHKDQLISLKESSKKIEQLSQKMQKRKELHKWVSVTLLTDLIYDWIKEKYKNVTDLSMVDYVLGKSQESIEELEIWIPIAELYIQSEIKIGRVTLRTIKRDVRMLAHSNYEFKSSR